MLLSRHQNTGQNHNIKVRNRCYENVVQFKYLVTTIIIKNLIQEEIHTGRSFTSGNACYHSVHNLFSSRLLKRKNQNIQNYNFACGFVLYVKLGL
jgi:hypothetical protein